MYHSGWQGKVLERFCEFQICQEADGYRLSDETVTRDAYASKKAEQMTGKNTGMFTKCCCRLTMTKVAAIFAVNSSERITFS